MQSDTRKILTVAAVLLLIGALAAVLMFTVFGGVTHQGPHTDGGWMALIVLMGCLPIGSITLLLGLAKVIGEYRGP